MTSIEIMVEAMRTNPNSMRFSDCLKVCTHYFGKPRVKGSHYVCKTPWEGESWVNLQKKNGQAKPYQVKQVLGAIEKLDKG